MRDDVVVTTTNNYKFHLWSMSKQKCRQVSVKVRVRVRARVKVSVSVGVTKEKIDSGTDAKSAESESIFSLVLFTVSAVWRYVVLCGVGLGLGYLFSLGLASKIYDSSGRSML